MNWTAGDWLCPACNHHNFRSREECQLCPYNRTLGSSNGRKKLPGDWYCTNPECGAHNFAIRSSCFKCHRECKRDSTMTNGNAPGWQPGDWFCPKEECRFHNYAARTECHMCKTPKPPEYDGAG